MASQATSVTPRNRIAFVPEGYSAARHIARTVVIASVIGGFSAWLARSATWKDWLLLPVFLLVANAIEWTFHKGPMHRPVTPRVLYENHTLIHHKAFHHDSMEIAEARELQLIMMPWATMLGLFALASPVALAFGLWRGPGVAGVFYIGAASYFLLYEGLHALYHAPRAVLARLGPLGALVAWLQPHHRHHHRLDRMSHANFNVTFPFMDWLMGTRETEASMPARAGAGVGVGAAEAEAAAEVEAALERR
jgi:hypothetical protein